MKPQTIVDVFYAAVERNAARVMTFKQTIRWIDISSHELYRDAVGTARTLESWGIHKGERVAILSENRPEWAVADFATLLLGAVDVPVYPTLPPDHVAYILNDSGARVAFVSTIEQLKKVNSIRSQTKIEKVVCMDYVGSTEGLPMHRMMHNQPPGRDAEFDARARQVQPDDLATIVYTSGTTGKPKGVMLTHRNLASNVSCSLEDLGLEPGHLCISFLPLSHITARHLDYVCFAYGVTLAYCANIDKVFEVAAEVRPTLFVAVPRIYEKVQATVRRLAGHGLKRSVYDWAIETGRKHRQETLAGKQPTSMAWKLADFLLYSKIRKAFGGNVLAYISGGAPLGRDLAEWFACVSIRIFEGYGLTETSPVIALNHPSAHKIGTVGQPLRNVEVRIAEDGEVLVRGPSVFQSYWNLPEETAQAFTPDGWFKTGDIGTLDAEGYLAITDRKKDLIKTSGGKFVAPQPIEKSLKTNPLVAEAVVIGDKRKFAMALVAPHFEMLESWAHANDVPFGSRQDLVANAKVQALYEGIVAEVNRNLAQFEALKRVLVVADEFTVADGSMTPSMKLRRRVVEERYRQQIEEIYAQPAPAVVPVAT
ncbi:MAG TPA: long-chain fatty acid--CoA ligase [Terriglobales bacterium]|nr:long-chain fatty acid--CoA ligase [Terriglobales bacterium]